MKAAVRKRSNSFDCIRIVAALAVLVSHQYPLTGRQEPHIFNFLTVGSLAVLVFFCLSGYLVSQSWARDPHIGRFILRRLLRIVPALAVVLFVSTFILGPLVTNLTFSEYVFGLWDCFKFLIVHLHYRLPGVFANNPFPVANAANGSLWTIPIEVAWYGILLITGVAGLLRRKWLLLVATIAFASWAFSGDPTEKRVLINIFGASFCAGACLNAYREFWLRRPLTVFAILTALALVLYATGHQYPALFVLLPYLTIALGTADIPLLRNAGRLGDLSYGTYIVAWPTQQTIIHLTANQWAFGWSLSASIVVSLVLAYVSWHWVEKPALGLKHYLSPHRGFKPAFDRS